MFLTAFTLTHVLISLIGIFSGFIFAYGVVAAKRFDRWNAVFLWTTVLTSVTGFLFPFERFLPSHALGILSLVVLGVAFYALYGRRLAGAWRATYAISALVALYFNVFVLIVQSFQKVSPLKTLAPNQTEPPFLLTQAAFLILFIGLAVRSRWAQFRSN